MKTRSNLPCAALCFLWWVMAAPDAHAHTPPVLYSGTLLDQGVAAPDGAYTMAFSLFADPTGGTPLQTSGPVAVSVQGGAFVYDVGSLFTSVNQDVYLEVSVTPLDGGPAEVLPRTRVGGQPFAVRASVADVAESVEWANVLNAPTPLQGVAGPTGPAGPSGPAGQSITVMDDGVSPECPNGGLRVFSGATDFVVCNGAPGATGAPGTAGATGATGPAGPVGATGVAGATGNTGAVGATGAMGPAGPVGATGIAGPPGPAGATGVTGTPGTPGPAGATGATGPAGAAGAGMTLELVATKSVAQVVAVSPTPATDVPFETVVTTPTLGSYNATTGVYTVGAGRGGMYEIIVHTVASGGAVAVFPTLLVNGTARIYGAGVANNQISPAGRGHLMTVLNLSPGDQLKIQGQNNNSAFTATMSTDGTSRIIIYKR